MLKNNILPTRVDIRKNVKKLVILNIIIYIVIGIFFANTTFAAQIKAPYTQGCLKNAPGYEQLIKSLKEKHPTWNFTILDTGIDWNEAIKNETVALHGRNLIYYTNSGSWVCNTCGDKLYDSGKWKCASETAVAYYMDPRNWLNENNIFQFEDLSYNEKIQNIDGVNKILKDVPWANGTTIKYTKPDGTKVTMEKSYAQVIMEAAKESGVSPYHLAARMKQEQGCKENASSTGSGVYPSYVGYYNLFNIKATGSHIIANALKHAKEQGWDDPEKAIKGGAVFIASEYIKRGQSTLYLQKFDVDNSDGAMYYHQYMQNVSAALTEGNTVRDSYDSMGMLNSNLNFIIPVYKNMPTENSISPDGISLVTQNVKVTGNSVSVRDGKGTACTEIAKVNKEDILLRIEIMGTKENDYYWDKVVLSNGAKGYIARDFIEQIPDVINAEISAIANVNVNLRNGPGTSSTKVLKTITAGQSVTILETGKYNGLDGYNWSRVKLSNGTQGYLVSDYLTEVVSTNYSIAYINCNADGKVNMRSGVGTENSVVTSLRKDEKVTVLQKSAGNANGYTWDKIVTADGLEGYIANSYLRYEGEKIPEGEKQKEESKEQNSKVVQDVDGNGSVNSTDLYYIIKFLKENSNSYNKMYDINQDGKVNSSDLYQIIVYLKQS